MGTKNFQQALTAQDQVRRVTSSQELLDFFTSAYSPDSAPSDYYLSQNMKSHLRGVRS